jgi:peptidoglycan/xylan/chitin deacetylase (PgdA/CDA1 family)
MQSKRTLFALAKRHGIFDRVADSEWRRRRLLILCYHGVSQDDEHEWNNELYVTPQHFRGRLQFLRDEGYAILPLDEACHRLATRTLPPRTVALTFDDGTVDFKREALPILREFSAPATLYLTTYYVGVQLPVFNTMLAYVLWKANQAGAVDVRWQDDEPPAPVLTAADRDEAYRIIQDGVSRARLDARGKNALLAPLAASAGVDYEALSERRILYLLSDEDVRSLPSDLIDVQLHTHRHRTPRDRALFLQDLADNRRSIAAIRPNGQALTHFCYPSGDYRGELVNWLREAGIRYATTCVPGLAGIASEWLLLPRFLDAGGHSIEAFEAWTTGFAALLPRRRRNRLDLSRLRSTLQ